MQKQIIIIGGGVTGCALAYFLSQKNLKVRLYEKTGNLGGLSRSVWNEELQCWNDIGPHIFHSPDPEITDLWKDLFSDLFQVNDYYSAIIKNKNFSEFHSYPISKEGINLISKIDTSKINFGAVSSKEQALSTNFREMMIAKLGPELEEEYFRYYPEKLWGMPTNNMRADWAPKRISIREKINTFFEGQFVATSREGAGKIYQRIGELIKKRNCEIHYNSEINKLSIEDSKIQSIFINGKEINTKNCLVVSTIPVPIIASLMGTKINLKYRGLKITNWITSERNILPNNYGWLYFDDKDIPFTRLTDYTKMSPDAISDDKGILTTECPFNANETIQRNDKENHLDQVIASLNSISWLKGKIIGCSSFFREPFVYPIREQGYEDELNYLNNKISNLENFWTIGAAGGFEYSDAQILFRKAKDFADDLYSDLIHNTNRLIVKEDKFASKLDNRIHYKLSENNYDKVETKIISEIGINHNGSIELAKKLIEESFNCGAHMVKFQLYKPEMRASVNMRDAFYSEKADGEGESLKELFESCYLSIEELKELKNFSDNIGIEMFLSAFDSDSVINAKQINANLIKISSMDLTNIEVWESAARNFKQIIASTGMSSLKEVTRSYEYAKSKNNKIDITLLHCVSSYPMPIAEAKLGRINLLRGISPKVGYSDHSTTIEIPYTASLLGAQVIEKHFTLDKSLKGPDHIHSALPSEMKRLVELIKSKSDILDTSIHDISKIQKSEMMKQKKGYFYISNLKAGHILKKEDIRLGAPCVGADTFECYNLIGKELASQVNENEAVSKQQFK